MTAVILSPGRLNRQIKLQTRQPNQATAQDSYGQELTNWTDWPSAGATTWAEIAPAAGREMAQAGAVEGEITHVITIRYRPGVHAKMRAVYSAGGTTRVYDILAVIEPETAHAALELLCSEGPTLG
jgi:SPP1 family predicted phage head-tail adaptor